jgi:YNFM family putative membrane transporter
MGLYVGGTAIGGLSGRVGGGVLTQLASWRAALGILGAIDMLAALCFLFLLPESRNFVRRQGFEMQYHFRAWSGHLRHRGLPSLFLIGGTVMGAFVTIYNYVGFLLKAAPFDLDQTEIGFIFVVYAFGIVASSVAGSLADRIGRGPVLVAGLLIELLGVALTLLHALTGVIVGVMALTIGFFVAHSVASGWVGRMAGTAKGHASSLYLFTYYAGSSVMGSVGGWFWATGGWPPIACFTAVLLLVGLGAGLQLRCLERRG